MPEFLLRFFLKVLFRFFNLPTGKYTDSESIEKWIANQYPDKGCQDYIFRRNMMILQRLGEGLPEKEIWIALGQRIELGFLLSESKKNWIALQAKEKAKRAKLEAERAKREKNENT